MDALERKECPDCGFYVFRPGPKAGIAQNIECAGCGSRFNIAYFRGYLVMASRIDNDMEWREDLYPKVLE